ncbi:hypothetical protein HOA55_04170 [archaeon]|jgi:hypothetical protein|nr:hypothetical protein [archaeon]MBT3577921.1 hypothetical protein [archaeon]MBT6820524.1 hypothetical protein [archaeon]MBT6956624.1 hypothetical protein [archaeon]MBT7025774.1 hypothetical protein [archaeon]
MVVKIKQSKPITELGKGDKLKINGREFEIDAQVVLIEHDKDTREMALEIFDSKADEDFQLRYFSNNMENSLEFYELKNEFMYSRVRDELKSVEW